MAEKDSDGFGPGILLGFTIGWLISGTLLGLIFLPLEREAGRNEVRSDAKKRGLGDWHAKIEISEKGSPSTSAEFRWKGE